ncbi:MAG: hypothetical protein L0H73_11655, partial [Nitrococcus sp.]|nr:hypothetical protein [Nitrococcus sp.]
MAADEIVHWRSPLALFWHTTGQEADCRQQRSNCHADCRDRESAACLPCRLHRICLLTAGHGKEDPLQLVVEIKGYGREDAKEKKNTMEAYWVPGVNNHGNYGRWAFAQFVDVWEMQSDFQAKVEEQFDSNSNFDPQPTGAAGQML